MTDTHSGLAISLVRENVFQQAISFWLSTQLKLWPSDAEGSEVEQLASFISQGDVVIPPEKLKLICHRFERQSRSIQKFSRRHAERYSMKYLSLTYEGIYQAPHKDVSLLKAALGVSLGAGLAKHSMKVLPPPGQWVANYANIAHPEILRRVDEVVNRDETVLFG